MLRLSYAGVDGGRLFANPSQEAGYLRLGLQRFDRRQLAFDEIAVRIQGVDLTVTGAADVGSRLPAPPFSLGVR